MEITELLLAIVPWVVIFGVFWFLFIRPQKKKQQDREDMLAKLATGDQITTIGGIKGVIKDITETEVTIKIAPEVEVEVTRNAIGNVNREES